MPSYQNLTESSYGSYNRLSVFEGLSVRLIPAPLLKRIFAYVIDLSIISAVLYILFIVLYVGLIGVLMVGLSGVFPTHRSSEFAAFAMLLFLFLILFAAYDGYFIYYEYKKGTTLGKKLFGLQVIATDRPRLSLGQCVLRDFFRLVDCLLIVPGLLSIALTKNHQRLGDLVAATMVVYSEQKESQAHFVYLTQEQYHLYKETLLPRPLTQDVCERFLQFAYPEFITKKNVPPTPQEYAQWEAVVQHFVPEAKKHSLDRTSLFLFFAEHCLQTLNQNPSQPQSGVEGEAPSGFADGGGDASP